MVIVIYSDSEYQIDAENVFLSNVYKSVKQFKKENKGMIVLQAYEYENTLTIWKSRKEEYTKKEAK